MKCSTMFVMYVLTEQAEHQLRSQQ